MAIQFKDFPLSYRCSQGGIAFAFVAIIFANAIFKPVVPLFVRLAAGSCLGLTVMASLVCSCYVIIRYPFLSLVVPSDGDHFEKHFGASSTWVYKFLKLLSLVVITTLVVAMIVGGINRVEKVMVLVYFVTMLGFMLFLTFVYEPVKHPTISTFLRSTLGIGVILFPFYIPILIIGSWRCRQLLNEAQQEL